ncbi:MAG: hypothetical protein IT376_07225 [Polyangiaceae bacterium]|nr:hypothetical protein [Polyangiaceae bacterium]
MTTDRSPTSRAPERSPPRAERSARLRHSLAALLATTYVAAWWAFRPRADTRSAEPAPSRPADSIGAGTPHTRWLEELPARDRPTFEVPAGWQVVGREAVPAGVRDRPAIVPQRVAPARRGRIRTRSS